MSMPSCSRLVVRNSLFARFGRIATNASITKLSVCSHWAESQQHSKGSTVRQFTSLALKTFLALVQEGKRKRDIRNLSMNSMAESASSGGIQTLRLSERNSPQDLKSKDFKKSSAGFRWQKNRPDEAEKSSASLFVDAALLRFLVGKGGSVKEKIERDTGVRLKIPSPKDVKPGKNAVILQGESQEALDEATHLVHEVIDQAIQSPQLQYSHFVSIPLALHSKLLESVVEFQKDVLESVASSGNVGGLSSLHWAFNGRLCTFDTDSGESYKGINKSIFVRPATFHLTLLMLKLWNEDRVQAAANCLQSVMPRVHEALEGSPLTVKLKGVDCMNGNAAKAHVLYADVKPDDQALRLIKASQVITEAFTEAGLVMDKDQKQTLKLHATLMNTSQRAGGQGKGTWSKRIPFDATEIVAKYEHYNWGKYHVSEAHLSQRFVYDRTGYYHCCSSIPFPEISKSCADSCDIL